MISSTFYLIRNKTYTILYKIPGKTEVLEIIKFNEKL